MSKKNKAAGYAAAGAAGGWGLAATVGNMGLAGSFGATAIGAAPLIAAGAVVGLAAYALKEALND